MERRATVTVDVRRTKNGGLEQRLESEVAFGPYRNMVEGEKYNPDDLTAVNRLLPIWKYGPTPNIDEEKTV